MGKQNFRRHLRAAAAVSLAAAVAACSGNRHEAAPVIMNGAGPGGVQGAPLAPGTVPPMNAAPRPLPPSGPGRRIVVRPGQSVGYLAREYGVSKQAIIEANNLPPPYKIEIGKELVIPGGGIPGGEPQ